MRSLSTLCWTLLAVLIWPSLGQAQPFEVTAKLSAQQVEVGQPFRIELSAMVSGDESPTEPLVQPPAGLRVVGPNIGTRTSMQFGGGQSSIRRGISATWTAVAERPGSFDIPPPSVKIGAQRIRARRTLRVLVVPATGKPSSRRQTGGWPFGGGLSPFDDIFAPPKPAPLTLDDLPAKARRLSMRRAPAAHAFVWLKADQKRVVVGQQVTLSYYLYYRPGSVSRMTEQREPTLSDFFRRSIDKAPGTDEELTTLVGGERFQVRLLERVALFPLRAGKLRTGQLAVKLLRGRRQIARRSNNLTIDVREPPLRGRPLGYRVGDVGRYSLGAKVEPRTTVQGDVVAVTVMLRGVGNLPQSLLVPQREGVEWLEPDKAEHFEEKRRGRLGGWRRFAYVVRLGEAGIQDLGEVRLPYFDPTNQSYRVARAVLGKVTVTPSKTAKPSKPSDNASSSSSKDSDDPFAVLAEPRSNMASFSVRQQRGVSPRIFWGATLLPPVGLGAFYMLAFAAGALRRRREATRRSPETLAKAALKSARGQTTDVETAACIERALHLGIEAATAMRSRAVLLDDLKSRLLKLGVDEGLSDSIIELLRDCERIRFEPGDRQDQREKLLARATPVIKQLLSILPELGGDE